jgi:hypothetical protein
MVNRGRRPYLTQAQQWRVAHGYSSGHRSENNEGVLNIDGRDNDEKSDE